MFCYLLDKELQTTIKGARSFSIPFRQSLAFPDEVLSTDPRTENKKARSVLTFKCYFTYSGLTI